MKTANTKKAASEVPMPPKGNGPTTSYSDDEKKWRAEDALRTLTRAEEIRADRRLMQDVDACRRDKMRQLANITIKVEKAPKTMKAK